MTATDKNLLKKEYSEFQKLLAEYCNLLTTLLFGLAADPRPISPHTGGQPNRSVPLTASGISKRAD